MTYAVSTPLLLESVDAARSVIDGVQSGAMEAMTATRVLAAARVLQTAVSTDIRARLAAPKIAAQEAKLIEQEERAALEKPSTDPRPPARR